MRSIRAPRRLLDRLDHVFHLTGQRTRTDQDRQAIAKAGWVDASAISGDDASFAFLLALLPATATIIGVIVLRQIPSAVDVLGVVLVMVGVAVHKPAPMPAPAVSKEDVP